MAARCSQPVLKAEGWLVSLGQPWSALRLQVSRELHRPYWA
jgi:hypothetical protein